MGERIVTLHDKLERENSGIPDPILQELSLPIYWCDDVWWNAELREEVCKVLAQLLKINFHSVRPNLPRQKIVLPNGFQIVSIDNLTDGNSLIITALNREVVMTTLYHYDSNGFLTVLLKLIGSNKDSFTPPITYGIHDVGLHLKQLQEYKQSD